MQPSGRRSAVSAFRTVPTTIPASANCSAGRLWCSGKISFVLNTATTIALLLLQVDDDGNGEDTQDWGPGGSLYFFMAQRALQEQNFAACEFEIQFT